MFIQALSRIHPTNILVAFVGLADLVSTLYWLQTGQMEEANPIMAALLSVGLPPFITVKIATLVIYVLVMEWYRRRHNPLTARTVGFFTAAAYITIYAACFCRVNYAYFLG